MADPTRPEPQKIDPNQPGSKNFDPYPSLVGTQIGLFYGNISVHSALFSDREGS